VVRSTSYSGANHGDYPGDESGKKWELKILGLDLQEILRETYDKLMMTTEVSYENVTS